MTCQDCRESFSDLIDDALPGGPRSTCQAHLASCPDCAREWERFRRTVALLRRVEPLRAPVGFVDRVVEAARPRPSRQAAGWPRWVKLPLHAAAIVLIAVSVYMVVQVPVPAPMREPAETPAADTLAEPRAQAASEARRSVARAIPPAALSGRLTVRDRDRAEPAIRDLITRIGGTTLARHAAGKAVVLEVDIPGAGYAELTRGLGRLGVWVPDREAPDTEAPLRISIRLE